MRAPAALRRSMNTGAWSKLAMENPVPVLFLALCLAGVLVAGMHPVFLINEMIGRMARNSFLVLSLIIPVQAGLGLNFGIVLGAMSAQAALAAVTHWQLPGLFGLSLTALLAVPIAVALGAFAGHVLNGARGREMIASMILGFFMNGVYQLVFLFMVGTVIPMHNPVMILPQGFGLRNTFELTSFKYSLDNLLFVAPGGIAIPLATLAVVTGLCLAMRWLFNTKLGQDLRAVGSEEHVAAVAGLKTNRLRITAVVFSTVLAAWGQIIFLQNIGTVNTYNSHDHTGMFAIAALLVGGATVRRATVGQALLGTFLFHLLFIVSPFAGQRLLGSPQVGEYFRVFIAYGIICIALGLHSWRRR